MLDLDVVLPGEGPLRRWRCSSTTCSPRPASRPGWRASRSTSDALLHTPEGKPRVVDLLDRAPRRRGADVLRLAPAQPDAGVDAHAVRHDQPARAPLHGRDLRLLPAGRQPAVEDAAADAAQAGPGVRASAWCWPRRTRSTSTTRVSPTPAPGSSAGCRPSATRRACSTAWRARPRRRRPGLRPRGDGADPRRPRQARVPDEQRARGRTRSSSSRAGRCRTCAAR